MQKRLRDIWDDLPDIEHTRKYLYEKSGLRIYEVCGKKFQETTPLNDVIRPLQQYHDGYGERARLARENKLVDWKAISHALRAAYQVKQLLMEGDITFPLREAEFLKQVKAGKLDYSTVVAPLLDSLMDEVEEFASKSTLPEKVDRGWWDQWLIKTLKQKMYQEMGPHAHLNF